jgi:hypothetical protein
VDIYKALGGGWNIPNPAWLSPSAASTPARPPGSAPSP